jgi:peptide/nickel transport system ATP-binding protein
MPSLPGKYDDFLMSDSPILEVHNLYKYFPIRQSLGHILYRIPPEYVRAIDGITFSLNQGEVIAIVGESGCGKTTIARTLIGLEEQTSGEILFHNELVGASKRHIRDGLIPLESGKVGTNEHLSHPHMSMKRLRQRAQIIFQDPYESLNPRSTIFEIVAEPLVVHKIGRSRYDRLSRVKNAIEEAGLRPADDFYLRFPHELSGGQRQRVVIASAMVLEPELLLADEPVSMLDVSIRAEILNLLRNLRDRRGISIVFITHDLSTIAYFADRIAVMYLGRIVEMGPTRLVLDNPQHPYTKALISVIPVPKPSLRRERIILQGETPNPFHLPSGCRFHPRCPIKMRLCTQIDPTLKPINTSHQSACLVVEGNGAND